MTLENAASFFRPEVALIALPIGNPEDISTRARKYLDEATRIFCEDTRKLKELCQRLDLDLDRRLTALPGDSEREIDWLAEFQKCEAKERWAFVSDAGTPVVNDPGRAFLESCYRFGVPVKALPGPCAPIMAWQWSGGFGLPFIFAGFAPKANDQASKSLSQFFSQIPDQGTFCFFDTKYQVLTTLEHLIKHGRENTKMVVAREMTKKHEELLLGNVEAAYRELKKRLDKQEAVGELTILIAGGGAHNADVVSRPSAERLIELRNAAPKAAAKIMSELTGITKADCYKIIVDSRGDSKTPPNEES